MKVKKLFRSEKDRVICGVCGGMAEYFNVDSSLIRVLWVLFACLGGSGILAYIIIAIILPEGQKVKTVDKVDSNKDEE